MGIQTLLSTLVLIPSLSFLKLGKQLANVHHVITQSIQVIPVSVATVLQQEPFMLFYQRQEGTTIPLDTTYMHVCMWMHALPACFINPLEVQEVLPLHACGTIRGYRWINDEVCD